MRLNLDINKEIRYFKVMWKTLLKDYRMYSSWPRKAEI